LEREDGDFVNLDDVDEIKTMKFDDRPVHEQSKSRQSTPTNTKPRKRTTWKKMSVKVMENL
jgi:hypothetical protein